MGNELDIDVICNWHCISKIALCEHLFLVDALVLHTGKYISRLLTQKLEFKPVGRTFLQYLPRFSNQYKGFTKWKWGTQYMTVDFIDFSSLILYFVNSDSRYRWKVLRKMYLSTFSSFWWFFACRFLSKHSTS